MNPLTLIFTLMSSTCIAAVNFPWTDNSELEIPSHDAITSCTNDISISYWLTKNPFDDGATILEKPSQFKIRDSGGGLKFVDFIVDNKLGGDALWRSTNSWATTNVWTMFTFTFRYTDTNSLRCYINGNNFGGVWINTPTNAAGNSNSSSMFIGANSIGGHWIGKCSEVAIWNSLLTQPQVKLLYDSKIKGIQKQVNVSTLKLYHPVDALPNALPASASTRWQDRSDFESAQAKSRNITGAHDTTGEAERVCSYQPNE